MRQNKKNCFQPSDCSVYLTLVLLSACVCKQPDIIHLDFCDVTNIQLPANQSDKIDSSQKLRSINYLVDESDLKCIPDSSMVNFIKKDSLIQNEISAKYAILTISFYHKSNDTDYLLKTQSAKNLLYCNNDLVADFEWRDGKYSLAHHYTNGVINGMENVDLIDLKHPTDSH